ncbi:alpha/beta fold hydrolase [Oleiphilus messinensis]|uniref:alpha/beta fold hydrolase n=1 Tax=Oleiphilus messinensis TaxID=141451 RepID=UPI0012F7645C|nr:alpha/beta hydrolase [Oleiphilus messinensis]
MPHIFTRDQQNIYFRKLGRGIPVLMLHGIGMDSRHWLPFITPYLTRFQFYLPDFRGAGHSANVPITKPDVFKCLKDDVEDLILQLKLQEFILVGYSLGASTALQLQLEGGFDQVIRYLQIDQSPCILNRPGWNGGLMGDNQTAFCHQLAQLDDVLARHPAEMTLQQLPKADRKLATQYLVEVLSVVIGNPLLVNFLRQAGRSPALLTRLAGPTTLHNLRSYLHTYYTNENDYRDSFNSCDKPVTVFIGKKSPLYEYNGQLETARQIKHCRTVLFNQSGHLPQVDEPIKFGRELGRFLTGPK